MAPRTLTHRLKKLEGVRRSTDEKPFRVLIQSVCGPLNLAKSTCTRTVGPEGQLTEVIWLDGNRDGLSDEELERFIGSFPVKRRGVSP